MKFWQNHNLSVGSDPPGSIGCINHVLESMPKQLAEAQTKLETVERQLETTADMPLPYPVENARHDYPVEKGNPQS